MSFFKTMRRFAGNEKRNPSMDWTTIGNAVNVDQVVNITVDPNQPSGFVGLPETWEKALHAEGVTNADIQREPEIAREIASIHFQGGIAELFKNNKALKGRSSLRQMMEQAVEIKTVNPKTYYSQGKRIGGGSFGQVFRVTEKATGQELAMKVSTSDKLSILEREIRMHALSNGHSNIVAFRDAFQFKKKIYLVVEMMDAGSLFDYIYELPKQVSWKEKAIVYVVKAMLMGLAFMHSRNHLHRDIKSQNILLNERGEVKIADFGFAVGLTKEEDLRSTVLGSPFWMAPELIGKQPYGPGVDCWATAITTFEMAESQPPHMGEAAMRVLFLVKSQPPPELARKNYWSENFEHFLKISLKKNPVLRPSTQELLMHPLFDESNYCTQEKFAKMMKQLIKIKEEG